MADASEKRRRKIVRKQMSMASNLRPSGHREWVAEATASRVTLTSITTTGSSKSIKPAFEKLRKNITTMMNLPLVPVSQPPPFDPKSFYEDRLPSNANADVPPPVPRKDYPVRRVNFHGSASTKNVVASYNSYRKSMMHQAESYGYDKTLDSERRDFVDSVHGMISEIERFPDEVYHSRFMQASLRQLEQSLSDLESPYDPRDPDQANRNLADTMNNVLQTLVSSRSLVDQYNSTTQEAYLSSDEGNSKDGHASRNSSDSGNETADGMKDGVWISIPNKPNKPLRRAKSSGALLSRPLTSESSTSEVELDEAKACSPVDVKRSIWDRLTSSKKKAAKSRPAHHPNHISKLEGVDEAIEFLKEAARNDRTQINRPEKFLEANLADRNVNEKGKVTDLSARAILHQMCIEHRYPLSLTSEAPELVLTEMIFSSFRIYWKPKEFASMLRDLYRTSLDPSAIVGLVEKWLFEYWSPPDRDDTHGAIRELTSFLGEVLSDSSFGGVSAHILAMLTRLSEYASGQRRYAIPPVQPNFRKSSLPFKIADFTRNLSMEYFESKNVAIREFFDKKSMDDFARQLTLRESGLINAIKPFELVNNCIKPGIDEDAEKRIVAQREFGNRLGRWARWAVYRRSTPVKRAEVVGFLCRLTLILLKLRNYESANTIYAAISGLSGDFMENLPLTRAALKVKTLDRKCALDKWFRDNKGITRSTAVKIAAPTVPVIATFAGRLTRNAADKPMVSKSSVDGTTALYNLSILEDAKNIVTAMEHCQLFLYPFKQFGAFQRFFDIEFGRAPDTDEEVHQMYKELKAFELEAHDRKVAALEFD